MKLIGIILFAVALNIDALSIGLSYGLRNIRIPLVSLLILSAISMITISLSMCTGQLLSMFIPFVFAQLLGGSILIILGMLAIFECIRENEQLDSTVPALMQNKERNFLKIPFKLIQKPELADMDHSGTVIGWEAFLLGMTLALDSCGAGVAISLQGFSVPLTALFVGLGQIIFTYSGIAFGKTFSTGNWGRPIKIIAGGILIIIGLLRVIPFFHVKS
jgi:putative sporulation protein YtaF